MTGWTPLIGLAKLVLPLLGLFAGTEMAARISTSSIADMIGAITGYLGVVIIWTAIEDRISA